MVRSVRRPMQDLEVIDGKLAQLFAASRANDPKAIALVVSDHGFVQITHKVNLMQPFLRAGLLQSGGSWKAQPWSGSGMAAVMLHDPSRLANGSSGARFAAGHEGGSQQRHRRGAGARRHQAARRISRRIVSDRHETRLLRAGGRNQPFGERPFRALRAATGSRRNIPRCARLFSSPAPALPVGAT